MLAVPMDELKFPSGFLWGAATASYQIEGHPLADGACPSVWHEFSHRPGKVQGGHHGDLACDHYRRWPDDIRHMRELGLAAYRFSVSWPRIVPRPGEVNPAGLDYYRRLVDGLLEAGIRPFLTLFHWDTPLWLERMGGFARRESVEHLAEYGAVLFRALGDRVKDWITVNEPMVYAVYGYVLGRHAPGYRNRVRASFAAGHHLLLGHGRLAAACRQLVPGGRVGIAQAQLWVTPARPADARDREAAGTMDAVLNRMYLDPVLKGAYPERILRRFGRWLPQGFERDLADIRAPIDFIGVNYYTAVSYRYAPFTLYTRAREVPTPGARRSAMWEIRPEGLYRTLMRLAQEYGNPACLITENGYPLPETPGRDSLEDAERIEYLQEHLRQARRAMQDGVDLRGYFVWSLMDNFEWHLGYDMRFGLIRVDFDTQERTWRRSAGWYRDLIRSSR
jgi:beta-glucosidase